MARRSGNLLWLSESMSPDVAMRGRRVRSNVYYPSGRYRRHSSIYRSTQWIWTTVFITLVLAFPSTAGTFNATLSGDLVSPGVAESALRSGFLPTLTITLYNASFSTELETDSTLQSILISNFTRTSATQAWMNGWAEYAAALVTSSAVYQVGGANDTVLNITWPSLTDYMISDDETILVTVPSDVVSNQDSSYTAVGQEIRVLNSGMLSWPSSPDRSVSLCYRWWNCARVDPLSPLLLPFSDSKHLLSRLLHASFLITLPPSLPSP
eukprot:TRINITY_DN1458_c0_g1_i3.p1 TRINITY_DN1458_c0_g1~~TRINITY_DN1458_c0_g1_i3.p1  ORF type:complete len:267 (+),score=9.47 TRINITY_DN1458_c0_g1_i3:289-1089(+)